MLFATNLFLANLLKPLRSCQFTGELVHAQLMPWRDNSPNRLSRFANSLATKAVAYNLQRRYQHFVDKSVHSSIGIKISKKTRHRHKGQKINNVPEVNTAVSFLSQLRKEVPSSSGLYSTWSNPLEQRSMTQCRTLSYG